MLNLLVIHVALTATGFMATEVVEFLKLTDGSASFPEKIALRGFFCDGLFLGGCFLRRFFLAGF